MTIFEFNFNDGQAKDWIFANDLEDAKEFYMNLNGFFESDLEGYMIHEVPEHKWSEMQIIDINDYDEEEGEYKVEETFKEYAERNTITDIIATTEY